MNTAAAEKKEQQPSQTQTAENGTNATYVQMLTYKTASQMLKLL